jgi:hypothetical protein
MDGRDCEGGNMKVGVVHARMFHDLVRPLGPAASVYIGGPAPGVNVDGAEDLDLRWRAIAADLHAQGADAPTVDVVRDNVVGMLEHPREAVVFAAAGQVLLAMDLPGAVERDRAVFAAPPVVAPAVGWLQRRPAFVEVVTDRTGAQVTAVAPGGVTVDVDTVVGPDDEIERNAPGGWSQPRFQRRAEDSWRHNAAAVADAAATALRRVDADLLLVAGDVRAVQLLRERLPRGLLRQVSIVDLPGGRSPDGSAAARRHAAEDAVAAHSAARIVGLLARLDAAPLGVAVRGASETLHALAFGRVHTLLVADDPDDRRAAWFGPDLLCVEEPVPADPVAGLRRGRLVDVAIRAALLTDAEVCVLGDRASIPEGLAAICRFE